jgi:hypothetical protein
MSQRKKPGRRGQSDLTPVRPQVRTRADPAATPTIVEGLDRSPRPDVVVEPTHEVRAAAVARRLGESAALRPARDRLFSMGEAGWQALHAEVAAAAVNLLDIDVGSVCLQAWGSLAVEPEDTRAQAANRTLAIAPHRVVLVAHPVVEVIVADQVLMTIPLTVSVDVAVDGLTLLLRGAEVARFEPGPVQAQLHLAIDRTELATRWVDLDPEALRGPAPRTIKLPADIVAAVRKVSGVGHHCY